MLAVEITQPGLPEVLKICERPMPEPKAGELLIKVHAAGVNGPDIWQRRGTGGYTLPKEIADIPGLEVAGEVVGGDIAGSGFKQGDMVCALVLGGGYAEYCTAAIGQCLPIPKGLSASEAASLPETFFTVWSNVFDRGRLSGAETLLVQGGTSGIGVAAIQIATALGHRVFATAGTDEKRRACEVLGAVRGINYKTEDFAEVVKAETGGKGVDVILDMIGGDYVAREIRCLADDGRLVFIALAGGNKVEVSLGQIMMRRLTVTGSTLRLRPESFKSAIAARLREVVWPLIEAGKIKPVVHQTFALKDAAQAHALIESSAHIGKVVLKVI